MGGSSVAMEGIVGISNVEVMESGIGGSSVSGMAGSDGWRERARRVAWFAACMRRFSLAVGEKHKNQSSVPRATAPTRKEITIAMEKFAMVEGVQNVV